MTEARLELGAFAWVDVIDPSPADLASLAERYRLHHTSVADCLQPEHLPKAESIDDVTFAVVRAFDPECGPHADTIREVTRKIAIFQAADTLLTIHRVASPYVAKVWQSYANRPADRVGAPEMPHVVADLLTEVVGSYQPPLTKCLDQMETFENEIFGHGTRRKFHLMEGYYLRRRAGVLKNILHLTIDPVAKLQARLPAHAGSLTFAPLFQNVREQIDGALYTAADVAESINSLIGLHISLQSQRSNEASRRTNEVMRVLTIFSCFFLPINFIAGVYGMNFEFMPELHWTYGYPATLSLMVLVSALIYRWFYRKGWLKGPGGTSYEP